MSVEGLRRRGARVVILVLMAGGLSWGGYNQVRVQWVEQHAEAQQIRFEIMQLQRKLQIPSEAIYYDGKVQIELAEARARAYERRGATVFLPYSNLVRAGGGFSLGDQLGLPAIGEHETHVADLANASPENFWVNSVGSPCLNLAGQIRENQGLGAYFIHHPEEFEQFIMPLIVRLLDGYHPSMSIYAVEVLFAAGERSEPLMEWLSIRAGLSESDARRVDDLCTKYGVDVALNPGTGNRGHEGWIEEWPRIHALVLELKKKYPVVDGTIIDDWRVRQ